MAADARLNPLKSGHKYYSDNELYVYKGAVGLNPLKSGHKYYNDEIDEIVEEA